MPTTAANRDLRIAEILDNLRRVFQVVHGYSKRAERIAGFTGPQLWAMKVLAESAPIRVSDLARRMYLRPPTVVGILDRLERQGQVARARSTDDHRVVTVTPDGEGEKDRVDGSPGGAGASPVRTEGTGRQATGSGFRRTGTAGRHPGSPPNPSATPVFEGGERPRAR